MAARTHAGQRIGGIDAGPRHRAKRQMLTALANPAKIFPQAPADLPNKLNRRLVRPAGMVKSAPPF
jgi:hypothetical protein